MNNKNIITKTKIMGLVIVLLMGILVGCPTEAPKEKDKSGDDGGPPPDFSINISHRGSHEIVATTSVNIDIDGEITFVITDSIDEPTIPDPEIITDGFITRTFTNGQTRQVYMAQLGTPNFPSGDSLGTSDSIGTLHDAFMNADTDYYLHTFYTKEGDDEATHTSKKFRTTAHRNSGNAFDGVKTIELKLGKENLNVIVDFGITFGDYGISTRFPNGVVSGECDLGVSPDPADCAGTLGYKAILFETQSLYIVKGLPTSTDGNSAIGLWKITHNGVTYTFTVTAITE